MSTKSTPHSIGRALNFAAGRMNALCQEELEPHGLSLPQWVVLSCLWREGDLTLSALAERAGATLPATSRIVDRMVQRELVTRRRDQRDARVTFVALDRAGRELDHLADFHERINAALFAGFRPEERDAAFDLLERLRRNAEAALGDQPLKRSSQG